MPVPCYRFLLTAAAVFAVSGQAAHASDWHFILKADKKEALAFFDMASVVKLGGKIGLLSMLIRREESNFPNTINAISFEEAFDCKAQTVQLLGETTFGPSMKVMKFTKITTPPTPVAPSTFERHKLDIVCSAGFAPGKRSILYMPVVSDLPTFRDHFVQQELAAAKALEQAKALEAGIVPQAPVQPPSIFNRK
jgi:hypothetical protein